MLPDVEREKRRRTRGKSSPFLLIPRQLGRQLLPQHIDQSQELALAPGWVSAPRNLEGAGNGRVLHGED